MTGNRFSPPDPKDAASPARPPVPETAAGKPRRVGVEIEFAGLDVPSAAALVRDVFGGRIVEEDPHRLTVTGTEFGDFVVELDAQIVHKQDEEAEGTPEAAAKTVLPDEVEAAAREALGKAVTGIVPVEIVSPPIPWSDLGHMAALTEALREAGAKGTGDNPVYAFGLHLNPEVPATDATTIFRHLQAYVVLADWLRDEIDIDVTRRLMPHSDPFPRGYVLAILADGDPPGLEGLIDGYLEHNPTRNRELDMLPLFRHLDEQAVMRRLDDPLIKARPTFHYRLPDCALGDPDWSPVTDWNRWVRVEELAADETRLKEAAAALRAHLARPAPDRWLEQLRTWFTA